MLQNKLRLFTRHILPAVRGHVPFSKFSNANRGCQRVYCVKALFLKQFFTSPFKNCDTREERHSSSSASSCWRPWPGVANSPLTTGLQDRRVPGQASRPPRPSSCDFLSGTNIYQQDLMTMAGVRLSPQLLSETGTVAHVPRPWWDWCRVFQSPQHQKATSAMKLDQETPPEQTASLHRSHESRH